MLPLRAALSGSWVVVIASVGPRSGSGVPRSLNGFLVVVVLSHSSPTQVMLGSLVVIVVAAAVVVVLSHSAPTQVMLGSLVVAVVVMVAVAPGAAVVVVVVVLRGHPKVLGFAAQKSLSRDGRKERDTRKGYER